jgi:hypothetical protein
MEITMEWAIATIARQSKLIEEQEQAIVLLEREISGNIDTSELSLLPEEVVVDACDPLETGTFKAIQHARAHK